MSGVATVAALAASYIAAGTVQTLSLKWADRLSAPDRNSCHSSPSFILPDAGSMTGEVCVDYSFAHPFSQAFFMFMSELVCLIIFLCLVAYRRMKAGQRLGCSKDLAFPCNPCVWMLPAGADFLASVVQNVGMMLTYASVYQMLRGATVVWTGVISYYWLGRRFSKVEYWGMGFVLCGLSLVGLSSLLQPSATGVESHAGSTGLEMFGNVLVVSAQVLHAYQGVCEERLVRLYDIPPLQMVGMEGFYGIIFSMMLLSGLQLVRTASWTHNIADTNRLQTFSSLTTTTTQKELHSPSWVTAWAEHQELQRVPYDDLVLTFDQLARCTPCLVATILYIVAGFIYNGCQITIIKRFSAASTVMLGSLRNVSVWAVCLAMPSIFHERFNPVQFVGFLLLVGGNVLFQRLWITSFREVLPESLVVRFPLLFSDGPRWAERDAEQR